MMDEVVCAPRRSYSGMLSSRISGASPSRSDPLLPTCAHHAGSSKSGRRLRLVALVAAAALLLMVGGFSYSGRAESAEAQLNEALAQDERAAPGGPAHRRQMHQAERSTPVDRATAAAGAAIEQEYMLMADAQRARVAAEGVKAREASAQTPSSSPTPELPQTAGSAAAQEQPRAVPQHEDSERDHAEAIAKMHRTRAEHAAEHGEIHDPAAGCTDFSANCRTWAAAGECKLNHVFMHKQCRWSCGVCGSGAPWVDGFLGGAHADDDDEEEEGQHEEHAIDLEGMGGAHEEASHVTCADIAVSGNCAQWAEAGECERNTIFMERQCKKSCGRCTTTISPRVGTPLTAAAVAALQASATRMTPLEQAAAIRLQRAEQKRQQAENAPPGAAAPGGVAAEGAAPLGAACSDSDSRCELWAEADECRLNPKFMNARCPAACGLCGS